MGDRIVTSIDGYGPSHCTMSRDGSKGLAPSASAATLLAVITATLLPAPLRAESLQDALRQALRSSPILAAAQADTVATSENITQARANGRPRASLSTSETEFIKRSTNSTLAPTRTLRSDMSISVPLYRSGVVRYAVKEAEERYDATTQTFRATVANLFAAIVEAYSDVLRDEAIVRASERNVTALRLNLRAIKGRFSIGDMTVTDVALSEARLSLAEGSLQAARAQLVASRESYIRVVGHPAAELRDIAPWTRLPERVDAAVSEAIANNGTLRAARIGIDAAGYRIKSLEGERGLQVSAIGSGNYFNNLNSVQSRSIFAPQNRGTSAQVGVLLDLPLYQGGLPASRIRQALADRNGAIEQAIAIERDIVAQARSAYAAWRSAQDYLDKAQIAITANEKALKGARSENALGTRTLLDVLDTERELFNNYVIAASVRRDINVAAFNLLALMGRADPDDLGILGDAAARGIGPVAPRGSWSDWADGARRYASASTTTQSTQPQDGFVAP